MQLVDWTLRDCKYLVWVMDFIPLKMQAIKKNILKLGKFLNSW